MKATPDAFIARRTLVAALLAQPLLRPMPLHAALSGGTDDLLQQYAEGARASGGRGASTMLRSRSDSGVERMIVGADPQFKPGEILDTVRSTDGGAVDVSFAFPEAWTSTRGPNLDVRDVRASDSAYLLGRPLPRGKSSVDDLPKKWFADLIFDPDGKYGAYGGVDDYAISKWEVTKLTNPSGASQSYRRFALRFDALTYNSNLAPRNAYISATSVGGTAYVLVAGCMASRYKAKAGELRQIVDSFRAYRTPGARAAEVESRAAGGGAGPAP